VNRQKIVFLDAATYGDISLHNFTSRWDYTIHQVTITPENYQVFRGQLVAVTNKVVIDRAVFLSAEAKELKLIAVAATGTDIIDRGRPSSLASGFATSGYATQSVAQFTLALMLELAASRSLWRGRTFRRVAEKSYIHTARFSSNSKEKTRDIGYGNIGRAVADMAPGFGFKCSLRLSWLARLRPLADSAAELLRQTDVITLHCR
jgi:glycerate dehydrogenase